MVRTVPGIVADGRAHFVSSLDASLPIRLSLVLHMRDGDGLRDQVAEVTDPCSPQYRHFLSFDELARRYAPPDDNAERVIAWASHAGLRVVHRTRANYVVVVDGTVDTVQRLLGIRLGDYAWNGRRFFSNDREPHLSPSVAPLLDGILGLNGLAVVHGVGSGKRPHDLLIPRVPSGPFRAEATGQGDAADSAHPFITSGLYEPPDIASSSGYDFNALQSLSHCCNPSHDPGGSPKEESIAIVAPHLPAMSDIAGFTQRYGLAYNFTSIQVDEPSCCDDEATLDAEWAIASANSFGSYLDTAHVYEYSFGGGVINDFYDGIVEALTEDKARVLSMSVGSAEGQYSPYLGFQAGISLFANLTLSAALTGWTVVAAAGDNGAYDDCSNKGTQGTLAVQYPASDPLVLGVGGTSLQLTSGPTFVGESYPIGD